MRCLASHPGVDLLGTRVLNQLSAVTWNTNLTVAGMTTPAATSVTVNGAAATLYADKTFAKEMANVRGGSNTFTAVATDGARTDTNAVTVTLPGMATFHYDANGNLTNDTRRTFEYDDADELTVVQVGASWRSEFKYDGLGRRRVRSEKVWQSSQWVTSSETRYVYDHMLVLQERDANNLPTVTYTRGIDLSGRLQRAGGIGGLLAFTLHSSPLTNHFYYHADAGGNITALIDGYQNLAARYRYDPFGNLLGLSGPMAEANLYRFSSKEWHANSGTYYYGFRFYEPSVQRWINRDPLGERGAVNLYVFLADSPLSFVDPFGLDIRPGDDEGKLTMVYMNHWLAKLPEQSLLRKKVQDLKGCKKVLYLKTLQGCEKFGEGVDANGHKRGVKQDNTPHYDRTTRSIYFDVRPSYIERGKLYTTEQALAEEVLHAWWDFFDTRGLTHGDDQFDSELEELWKELGRPTPIK